MLWGDWNVCVFESLCLPLDKISCTRQFEIKLSLRSFAKSLAKRIFSKTYPQWSLHPFRFPSQGTETLLRKEGCNRPLCCFSKIIPSFFTIKEGSTSHLGLLPSGKKRKTALRCSEPLRYKVGGASKPSPCFAGWDRLTIACYGTAGLLLGTA